MNIPFLDLAWQEAQIREDRERRFADIIAHTAFVLGPAVVEFEKTFAAYADTGEAIGVSGGTYALAMIFRALGIGKGDEVITIPNTFIASITGLIGEGARPVFVDIDPTTRNFDFNTLEAAITSRTKVILPVHLYGIPADMDAVQTIAKKHDLIVIEDACQAHGATYKGKQIGSFGKAAAFSFYPGKNLGAYGDGGAVVTDDAKLTAVVRALRNQGCVTKYDHEYLGFNGRLDALQAAVLSAKLPHLDTWNKMRRAIAARYFKGLASLPLGLPQTPPDTESVWHLFVVEVPGGRRDDFMSALKEKGVATGIHYPVALHETVALAYLGYKKGDFPNAEKLAAGCVSLPLYPGMTDEQVEYVIRSVRDYFHA